MVRKELISYYWIIVSGRLAPDEHFVDAVAVGDAENLGDTE
jgi:hypothetical protein